MDTRYYLLFKNAKQRTKMAVINRTYTKSEISTPVLKLFDNLMTCQQFYTKKKKMIKNIPKHIRDFHLISPNHFRFKFMAVDSLRNRKEF